MAANPSAAPASPAFLQSARRMQPEHLALIFDGTRDMMLLGRVEPRHIFRVVAVNRPYVEAIRAAGYALTAADFSERTLPELLEMFGLDEKENAVIRARFEEAVRTGRRVEFDETTSTPTGSFHGRTTITPIPDNEGRCAFVLYSSQDVTARMRAEQALRESEEKFGKAFMASPDAISVHDLETGRYVEVNEGLVRLFGFSRDEIVGRTPMDLGIWADTADRAAFVERLRREGAVRNHAVKVRRRDGETRLCELSAEVFEIGGRLHNVTVLRDITEQRRAEEALRESEERFAAAFRASPDMISITDFDTGHYLEINRALEAYYGRPSRELVGRTPEELGVQSVPDPLPAMQRLLAEQGQIRDLKVPVRTRDGRTMLISLSAEIILIGGRKCVLRITRDITAASQAEQALRESEAKFATAFRASPAAMSIVDLASRRYIEVNQMHEELFGHPRAEVIGRTPEEIGILSREVSEAARDRLRAAGRVRDLEMVVRTRQGEERTVLNNAEPIRIDGRDCALLISLDITARKRAEAALRESETKFATAFHATPYAMTISELATGGYVDVNHGFEQISGYARHELMGKTSLELNLWADPAERPGLVERLSRDGRVRDREVGLRARDGNIRTTLCTCEVIEVAGVRCILTVLQDVTEQRRASREKAALEEQMRQNQKLEALGTLAGGIAHDFNNILTAIIVNQELATMDLDDPANLRRRLDEIGSASLRAKELVRQILTFSRQQAHEKLRQPLQMVVREALGLVRASLPATIEIAQDLAPDAPPVLADASQVHQVVMNLSTNAAHAMRQHGGRLGVRLEACTLDTAACRTLPGLQPGRYARLSVADTGHGMEPSVLERIFEPFFTTKGPGEGTGLGLAMVHGIMRNHGGGIFVASRPGAGTTFDLYFPAADEPESRIPIMESEIVPGHGEAVLIVDDEPAICEAIGLMLARIGYRAETMTDPEAAWQKLREAPSAFDLLLTDRTMPHLTGPELIARVRSVRPGLPAILMSGHNSQEASGRPEAGPDYEWVAKPMDIAQLSRVVQRTLARHRAPPS